jgi:hypothetical protein
MSNSIPIIKIKDLCKVLEVRTHSTMSLEQSRAWLMSHQQLVQKTINLDKEKFNQISSCFDGELKKYPIRRNDGKTPKQIDPNYLIERFNISKTMDEETQKKLLLIWTLYQNDREALMHQLIFFWNQQRNKLKVNNQVIPYDNFSLTEFDSKYEHRLDQADKLFSLTLVCSALRVLNQELPPSWPTTYSIAVNGFKTKNQDVNESDIIRKLSTLLHDHNYDLNAIPKLEKKRVMIETNMDLHHFNFAYCLINVGCSYSLNL